MTNYRLSRQLTPESRVTLNNWQDELAALQPDDMRINPDPTLQVVGGRLMSLFLQPPSVWQVRVPRALHAPLTMETHGIRFFPPMRSSKNIARLILTFENPDQYTAQRTELLLINGAKKGEVGSHRPLLQLGTIHADELNFESLAKCTREIPSSLEFMPLGLEAYED